MVKKSHVVIICLNSFQVRKDKWNSIRVIAALMLILEE